MENKQAPIRIALDKNYDSEFCGSLPLHLVNLIQPHGILLTLQTSDLTIIQVSENVTSFLGLPVEEILDQPIASFLPEPQFQNLQEKVKSQTSQDKIPFPLNLKWKNQEIPFTALVHLKEGYLLIELEENKTQTSESHSFTQLYQQTKYITSLLREGETIKEIAQITVDELKKLSGYDRILAYQFDPQWNGMVIGQAKEEDMDDYLGLRFPASDVPRQTRDLFLKNPYRIIPTRSYQPARLIPIVNPVVQQFTDLSDCNLRSVATVHLEYMGNMNIMASMSLPIIVENKLWGLISFHHRAEKNPNYELRSALELLSGILSGQLAAKEKEIALGLQTKLKQIHTKLLEQLFTTSTLAEGLLEGETTINDLLSLSGVAILYEGGITTHGLVPSNQEIKELVFWLKRNSTQPVYATDTLPKLYSRARDYPQKASGILVININPEQGEYILGFRPEVLQTISWGGNPNRAVQMEADGKTYHPRNSFATYQETVKHTSLPWLQEEIEAAENLRSTVLEKIIKDRY